MPSSGSSKSNSAELLCGSCKSSKTSLFLIPLLVAILLVFFGFLQYHLPSFYCSTFKKTYNSKKVAEARLLPGGGVEYSIIIISDLDHNSKLLDKKNTWQSLLYQGKVVVDESRRNARVNWDKNIQSLQSQISAGGRAMELSDLVLYDERILSVDDRTGIIYEVIDYKSLIPWVCFLLYF